MISIETLKEEIGWPEDGIRGLFEVDATLYVLAYYALSLFLQVFLPGTEAEGVKLACGGKHKYKLNSMSCPFVSFLGLHTDRLFYSAFNSSVLILAGCGVGTYVYGTDFPVWNFLWEKHLQVITANYLICVVIAVFVYVRSFTVPAPGKPNPSNRELAPGGATGNPLYDFFIGRELNPRITLPIPFVSETSRTIDIKTFCELRPGLLGWIILNLSGAVRQYRNHGQLTDSILMVTAFQAFYVLESYYMESALLTTIDVIYDGFGFMLSFGDLVWVPFIYSVQSRYLAVYPLHLGIQGIAMILAVQSLGYYIFRSSNNQKNRFRTNPNDPRVSHLKHIETSAGSKLLISGWWGYARHINYLGDWVMSWSYCLPTGFAGYLIVDKINPATGALESEAVQTPEIRGWGIIPMYFFLVYFAILLIHRERRDEAKCKNKYGADWDRYTSIVRSRIVPGIY